MKRREFITLIGGAVLGWPLATRAQQAAPIARLGFLSSASAASIYKKYFDELRAGLHELSYVEGQNLIIESRWAEDEYDRLPQLAGGLVRLNIDVLITHGTPAVLAAKRTTATIPIVMAVVGDAHHV
jgi:putative tryptophan/tyrosine transport system substrate-binding protein